MSDKNQPDQNINEQTPVAFCQSCGKPLSGETVRRVGTAVYCEPCLEARLGGSGPAGAGYQPVNAGPPPPVGSNEWVAGQVAAAQATAHLPNPGLAALLGLIPGVGAMYNEQYAKGIVHLLVFAVLITFSHVAEIFGLFAFGWICYMAIEAHHTARARRDGTPLPNPFGLNDIGDRMGFGKSWPQGADVAGTARDAVNAAAAGIYAATAGFQRGGNVPPAGPTAWTSSAPPQPGSGASTPAWGAPVEQYPSAAGYSAAYSQPPYSQPVGYTNPVLPYNASFVPPLPPIPPMYPSVSPPGLPVRNRFPAGAAWLIGLGMLFLLGTAGIFRAVPGAAFIGFGLVALGIWLFLRHMMGSGTMHYDGSPEFPLRVLRAMRGAIWLVVIGAFDLLDTFHVTGWGSLWPWLIILAGVMMLLERTAYNSAATAATYGAAVVTPAEAEPIAPASIKPEHSDTAEGDN